MLYWMHFYYFKISISNAPKAETDNYSKILEGNAIIYWNGFKGEIYLKVLSESVQDIRESQARCTCEHHRATCFRIESASSESAFSRIWSLAMDLHPHSRSLQRHPNNQLMWEFPPCHRSRSAGFLCIGNKSFIINSFL